jgi:hypothetical protein
LIVLLQLSLVNLTYTNFLHSTCHISYTLSFRSFVQRIHPSPRSLVTLCNRFNFFNSKYLTPYPTCIFEYHPLSAVCDCLFTIFTANIYIWRQSPPSTSWGSDACHVNKLRFFCLSNTLKRQQIRNYVNSCHNK